MKNQVSRKYVRGCFKSVNVQLSESALDDIIYHLRMIASKMALRCKEGNVKRLTSDLMFIALGKLSDMK